MKNKMKTERKVLVAKSCQLHVNLLALGGSSLMREMCQFSFKGHNPNLDSRPYGKQYRNRPFKL